MTNGFLWHSQCLTAKYWRKILAPSLVVARQLFNVHNSILTAGGGCWYLYYLATSCLSCHHAATSHVALSTDISHISHIEHNLSFILSCSPVFAGICFQTLQKLVFKPELTYKALPGLRLWQYQVRQPSCCCSVIVSGDGVGMLTGGAGPGCKIPAPWAPATASRSIARHRNMRTRGVSSADQRQHGDINILRLAGYLDKVWTKRSNFHSALPFQDISQSRHEDRCISCLSWQEQCGGRYKIIPGPARPELLTSRDADQCVQHLRASRMPAGRAWVRQFLRHQVQQISLQWSRCKIELLTNLSRKFRELDVT